MPRHTNRTKIRAQYSGELRIADRDKRRKRLANRKRAASARVAREAR